LDYYLQQQFTKTASNGFATTSLVVTREGADENTPSLLSLENTLEYNILCKDSALLVSCKLQYKEWIVIN